MEPPSYSNSIFINCPFDKEYEPLLHSIVFTVYTCGFIPRSALEADDSSDIRLDKIIRLIRNCKFGIHDISKTALDEDSALPRFNMPFELGLFWGAKKFGTKQNREKVALVFERDRYSYQKYLSDINGVDVKAHNNSQEFCINAIRNWLFTNSGRKAIPSPATIMNYFKEFMNDKLPVILGDSHLQFQDFTFNDYCYYVSKALEARNKTK